MCESKWNAVGFFGLDGEEGLEMTQYDLVFSCGFSCGVTQALREEKLQFVSLPFDWTASPSFKRCAEMVAEGFPHWMDRDDLELVDIRRGGINKHAYKNRRTGFGFVHDFSSFKTFEENYPKESEKYARRIARFEALLGTAQSALAVYAECPKLARVTNAELMETRRLFAQRYPQTRFDLLYFYVKEGAHSPIVETVSDGIVAVGLDYRIFIDGLLNHQIDHKVFCAYLKSHVSVIDTRSEEERRAYEDWWLKQDRARWHGKNLVETMINRTAYRIYRKVEAFLVRKGLVPKERPLWFV